MKTPVPIQQLTNGKNKRIIRYILSNGWVINLFKDSLSTVDNWEFYSSGNSAEIKVGKDDENICSLTHELLHCVMEIKGQNTPTYIHTMLYYLTTSFSTFTRNLDPIAKIHNFLMHYRMLPLYLKLKLPRRQFITDYNRIPIAPPGYTVNELLIGNLIQEPSLVLFVIDYFSWQFHPNYKIRRYYWRKFLKPYSVDHGYLVKKLDNLSQQWKNKSISNNATFFTRLISVLEEWKNNCGYMI